MKRPFLHALAAALYISVLVSSIYYLSKIFQDDNIFAPMAMLSLLVLSVSVMGYLFLAIPLQLFLENKKQEAMVFFGKVVGFFACFAVLFVVLMFLI